MNIGLYISPSHAVPPNEKNILAPWMLVQQLADGLVARDHDVTLFAAKGSNTRGVLVHAGIEPTVQKQGAYADADAYRAYVTAQELLLMREAVMRAKAGALDVLHIHQPVERLYPALLALPRTIPIVITFHDPIGPARFPGLEKMMQIGHIHFVSLSVSQQQEVPFPFVGVVPNGVDITQFVRDETAMPKGNRPLLMTGRIVQQKGFVDAIEAARRAGTRLLIVGQEYLENPDAKAYFETQIQPAIDGTSVLWEPVVKQEHLVGHYQTAKALLFPIHWEEPFGLVMIEAMACGTPVIAYNRGSVSEIVRDGLTGFIVDEKDGVNGLVRAIKRIGEIDRAACRKHVEDNFTISKMVERYEAVYANVLQRQK